MTLHRKAKFWRCAAFLLLGILFVPAAIPAAARDKGRNNRGKFERKADKFINGHDARDGRFDGRGPRRNRNWDDCYSCDDDDFGRRRGRRSRRR